MTATSDSPVLCTPEAVECSRTFVPDVVTPEAIREKIFEFEERLAQCPGAQFGDCDMMPLKHSFAGGMYIREIFVPAGTVVTGKIHRHEHPYFLLKGRATVVTEGGGLETLVAPVSLISPPGTKRVVFVHEDSVWVTVHYVGEERDLKKIEDIVIAKNYAQLEEKG